MKEGTEHINNTEKYINNVQGKAETNNILLSTSEEKLSGEVKDTGKFLLTTQEFKKG